MENRLPKGWGEFNISALLDKNDIFSDGDWIESKDQDPNGDVRLIQLADIGINEFRDKSNRYLTSQKAEELKCTLLKKNDVLIARMPDPIGRSCVFPLEGKFATVVDVAIVRINSKYINPRLLSFFINSIHIQNKIKDLSSGSTRLRISRKNLDTIKFPLPPLPEQERIVEKLDALFTQHEAMKKALERIPQLLKDFRQQVLTQATNGKLTEEWRKTKKFKTADDLFEEVYKFKFDWAKTESSKDNKEAKRLLSKIRKIKAIPIDTLPKQWGYFSLSDINHLVVDCHNKTAPYQDTGIYLIRTTNIKNGEIILKDIRFVSDETYQFWSKRCIPESGDIIFTREAPMGEAAIIPENMKICLGQRTMLIRTPKNILENKYVLYCLLSNEMKAQINKKAIGTGVKHLRVGDVEDLLIPIPPYLEQQEIVSRVESLFAKADTIEKRYKTLKEKIDSLPQAILHKAFKGKLVSQLPTDGDAKNLLEEILKLKKEVKKK
ncbi:type I restriction enzyme S subunit [Chryseobacterium vietnamense]|uniref:restriction endonuclease subunit S n=1 Tax=Chryseobacterium vietnamense TaxID=866785 RepID=UPI0028637C06|nr:restriction endonuclease subunit S [Chryseobacterium vietnamense]MDR6489137.1 type I restriction enzyme S subunit [Chryseobacterium vietnamense]